MGRRFIIQFQRGNYLYAASKIEWIFHTIFDPNGRRDISYSYDKPTRTDPPSPHAYYPEHESLATDWQAELKIHCHSEEAEYFVQGMMLPSDATLIERNADNANDSDVLRPN